MNVLGYLCRWYPLLSGCATLANHKIFQKWVSGNEPVLARLRNGATLWVDLNDFVGRTVYLFGDLDPKLTLLCRQILRPGDTFLDIGSNYGLVSMYAAELVGTRGAVHAFEPQRRLAELSRRSVESNGVSNTTVHNVALSDREAQLRLRTFRGNRGKATLEDSSGSDSAETVRATPGDQYLPGINLDRIRLIKMDVEGHEESVLRGCEGFFRKIPPDVIIFEANSSDIPWYDQPVFRWLIAREYRIFGIPKARFRLKLQPLDPGLRNTCSGHDYVAVHRTVNLPSLAITGAIADTPCAPSNAPPQRG